MRKYFRAKAAGRIVAAALSAAFIFMSTSTAFASTEAVGEIEDIVDPNAEARPNETLVVAEDGMIEHYCDVKDLDMEGMEVVNGDVEEVELYTAGVSYMFDWVVNPDTRHVSGEYKINAGMKLGVSCIATPENKYYWLGVMDDDGHARYVSGSGSMVHYFNITTKNVYRVFVQNNYKDGKTKINAFGSYKYQ